MVSFAARQTIVRRPSNNRLTGGKRLFDGRKIPDVPMWMFRIS